QVMQSASQLALYNLLRTSRVTFFESLAYANDRRQSCADNRANLAVHRLVRLAVVLSPLRMTDDRQSGARVPDHCRRYFTGERSRTGLCCDILRSNLDVRTF